MKYIRKDKIITDETGGQIIFQSINLAKKESFKLQMNADGSLGKGTISLGKGTISLGK